MLYHSCPICSKPALEVQPESGTHVFTINYECGTSLDYPVSGPGYSFARSCDEPKRPSLQSLFKNIRPRKLLDKSYIGENINDICRDISELWNNDKVKEIPNEQGIMKGKIEVKITWKLKDIYV